MLKTMLALALFALISIPNANAGSSSSRSRSSAPSSSFNYSPSKPQVKKLSKIANFGPLEFELVNITCSDKSDNYCELLYRGKNNFERESINRAKIVVEFYKYKDLLEIETVYVFDLRPGRLFSGKSMIKNIYYTDIEIRLDSSNPQLEE